MNIQENPTYEEHYTRGVKSRGQLPTFSASWIVDGKKVLLELLLPNYGAGFTARATTFDNDGGEKWSVAEIREVELAPGESRCRHESICDELSWSSVFQDAAILEFIKYGARKLGADAYITGYAMARVDELRRRVDAELIDVLREAADRVRVTQYEAERARKISSDEIEARIEKISDGVDRCGRLASSFAGQFTKQRGYAIRIVEETDRLIALCSERDRRAALSAHERLEEAAQRKSALEGVSK